MQVCVGVARTGQRYLMGAPRALGPLPIDFLRTRPALRGTENDHRPHRTFHVRVFRRLRLDSGDFVHDVIEDRRETRMDRDVRFVVKPGDEDVRLVAVTPHECIEFCVADSRQHRWIGDLVTVQVKDRQNHPVGRRVQELVGVPAGGERSGLGLAVTDNGCDEKMRIVECRPIRVGQRVAEFATLVDGARCLRRDVRGDSARKGELLEQSCDTGIVQRNIRVSLGVGAFQEACSDQRRAAMAGADDIHRGLLSGADHSVEMSVQKIQSRRRAPMTDQSVFDVVAVQRLAQERILQQVDLADTQVVARSPPPIDRVDFIVAGRIGGPGLPRSGCHLESP